MAKLVTAYQDCYDRGWTRLTVKMARGRSLTISRAEQHAFLHDPLRAGEWSYEINTALGTWDYAISDPAVAFEFKMRFG